MRTKKDMPGRATAKLEVIQLLQVAKKAPLAEIEAAIASPAE